MAGAAAKSAGGSGPGGRAALRGIVSVPRCGVPAPRRRASAQPRHGQGLTLPEKKETQIGAELPSSSTDLSFLPTSCRQNHPIAQQKPQAVGPRAGVAEGHCEALMLRVTPDEWGIILT